MIAELCYDRDPESGIMEIGLNIRSSQPEREELHEEQRRMM